MWYVIPFENYDWFYFKELQIYYNPVPNRIQQPATGEYVAGEYVRLAGVARHDCAAEGASCTVQRPSPAHPHPSRVAHTQRRNPHCGWHPTEPRPFGPGSVPVRVRHASGIPRKRFTIEASCRYCVTSHPPCNSRHPCAQKYESLAVQRLRMQAVSARCGGRKTRPAMVQQR